MYTSYLQCFLDLKQAPVSQPFRGKRFDLGNDLFRAKEENEPTKTPPISWGGTYLFFHLGRVIYIYKTHLSLNTPIYTHMHVRVREAACVRMRPGGER